MDLPEPRNNVSTFHSGSAANWIKSSASFADMMQSSPIAVIFCDAEDDFRINVASDAMLDAFRSIEHLLPCKASDIVGRSIDIFLDDPTLFRRVLSDPRNFPCTAIISLDEEFLELRISARFDSERRYLGPILVWDIELNQTSEPIWCF